MLFECIYEGKDRRTYICQVDGRQPSSSEEDVQERDRDGINHAVTPTVEGQPLLPVGGIGRVHGTVRILAPITAERASGIRLVVPVSTKEHACAYTAS